MHARRRRRVHVSCGTKRPVSVQPTSASGVNSDAWEFAAVLAELPSTGHFDLPQPAIGRSHPGSRSIQQDRRDAPIFNLRESHTPSLIMCAIRIIQKIYETVAIVNLHLEEVEHSKAQRTGNLCADPITQSAHVK